MSSKSVMIFAFGMMTGLLVGCRITKRRYEENVGEEMCSADEEIVGESTDKSSTSTEEQ